MIQNNRRGLRTLVHTIGAISMLAMLAWIVAKSGDETARYIGLGLIAILFVREMFHGAENVTARVKFSAGLSGVSGEVERKE